MKRYSDHEKMLDLLAVGAALEKLAQAREACRDLVVITDVITVNDVCDIALDTAKGPQRIGDVCSREEIVHILRAFEDNPCGDPALVAQYALEDYRQTQALTKE